MDERHVGHLRHHAPEVTPPTIPANPTIVSPRTSRELRGAGVSKHVLSGPRYRRTSPARYVPSSVDQTPDQRIAEAAAHMPPGSALGGWAAAYAMGARMLDGRDAARRLQPVIMCVPAPLHRQPSPGVRYVREMLEPDELIDLDGITFVGPVRTAGDLARWAPTLADAVVGLDAMLLTGVVDEPGLALAAAALAGRRGAKQARNALGLARPGVRSPGETRLRLVYVLEAGGGADVLVNPRVHDPYGRFLGMPDLLDVEAGLALEYDGGEWAGSEREAGHRDRAQHREDNVREETFERSGLVVARADGLDVTRFRRELVGRLQRARLDGLRRDRSRDLWRVLREW